MKISFGKIFYNHIFKKYFSFFKKKIFLIEKKSWENFRITIIVFFGGLRGLRAWTWDVGRGSWAPLKKAIFQCISAIFQSNYPKYKAVFHIPTECNVSWDVPTPVLELGRPNSVHERSVDLNTIPSWDASQLLQVFASEFGTRPNYILQVFVASEFGTRPNYFKCSQVSLGRVPTTSSVRKWVWDASQLILQVFVASEFGTRPNYFKCSVPTTSRVPSQMSLGRVPTNLSVPSQVS